MVPGQKHASIGATTGGTIHDIATGAQISTSRVLGHPRRTLESAWARLPGTLAEFLKDHGRLFQGTPAEVVGPLLQGSLAELLEFHGPSFRGPSPKF